MPALSSFQQALVFIVQSVFQIYIYIVLLRCLLQLAKADFYNPVSQAVVKLTSIFLRPLRRVLPSIKGIDTASLVLASLLYFAMLQISTLIIYGQLWFNLTPIIGSLAGTVYAITGIYFFAIIIAAISSWLPALMNQPIVQLVWQLVEPIQAPFRKILPDMGGIDISPIFALLILQGLRIVLLPYVPV